MEDLLETVLHKAYLPEIDFMDIRVFQKNTTTIRVETGRISKLINSSYSGAGVRVFCDGYWSHASTNFIDEENLMKTANIAHKIAKSLKYKTSNRERSKLPSIHPIKERTEVKVKIHPLDVSLEEKAKRVFELEEIARNVDSRIVNTNFNYQDSIMHELVVNSFGSNVSSKWIYTQLKGRIIAKEMNLREKGFSTVGKTEGFEVIEQIDPDDFSVEAARKAVSKLGAKTPIAGKSVVILDQRLTGLFAHECFGHAAEADAVIEGASIFEGMLGKQIASPNVSIIDDPTISGSFGFFRTDSEGTMARRKELAVDGILNEYLHTLETASKLNLPPNGSARASNHHVTPLARMASIYIQPKDYKFEELIEGVTGIYLQGAEFGHVDPATGEFLFKAEQGWNVEKGEIKEQLRDVALSGLTLETLRNIDAIGRDLKLIGPGHCGKQGQLVPVDDGGPHIRVKDVIVGGLQ
ncbi:MAG: TldD/PmbA family protein [Promethearchaeota archaeon]